MSELVSRTSQAVKPWFVRAADRVVGIRADIPDEEAQRGRLLNLLALTGVLISSSFIGMVVFGLRLGHIESRRQAVIFAAFPAITALLSLICIGFAKRGRVILSARVYVWVSFGAIAAGAALFNGYRSATWLVLIWPVALAGNLLRPMASNTAAAGGLLFYACVAAAQRAGLYEPRLPTALESFPFFALTYGWVMIVFVVGLMTYITGRSLRGALAGLQQATSDLALARDELSDRVDERTSQLAERAEQFRVVAELIQVAAGAEDLASLLDTAVELVSGRLGYYHVGIFLLDAGRRWAVLSAASSEGGRRMLDRNHQLRVGQQGIVGYVAEMGVSRYAFNVGADAAYFSNPDLSETRSEIALPLIVADRIIGVLDIQSREQSAFDESDVEVLRVLADGVAVSLENVRRLEDTQNALARLERYQEDDAVRGWRQALSRRHMRVGFTYRDGVAEAATLRVEGLGERIESVEGVTREASEDGRHLLLAPIRVSGSRLGVLSFESASPWTDQAVRLVENVANQLDLALTNARLLEETRLRASQEAARGEIVGRIRALNSTDAILRNAAEELGRALQVDRSRIQLVQFQDGGQRETT